MQILNHTSHPKTWRLACCLSVAMLALLLGCQPRQADEASVAFDQPPLAVNVVRARRDPSATRTTTYYGTLRGNREATLVFQRGGIVESVVKQVGDRADGDDLLAELDPGEVGAEKNAIEQALADLKTEADEAEDPNLFQQQTQTLLEQLAAVDRKLEPGQLRTPYPCIIAERFVDARSPVAASRPAFRVIEDAPPRVELLIPDDIVRVLDEETTFDVLISQTRFEAAVATIAPDQDSASRRDVVLTFDDLPEESWLFGATVEVVLETEDGDSGFWLPLSALQREPSGLWSVFVVEPKSSDSDTPYLQRRTLQIIRSEDEFALVDGALKDDDLVLIAGVHRAVPGQAVKPVEISDRATAPSRSATLQ